MAFFDKISSMAKNAADRTSDMFEISKINGKINAEKSKIAAIKAELGEYYWNKFYGGEQLDEGGTALCEQIKASMEQIDKYNEQIAQIKAENEAQAAAVRAPVQANAESFQQPPQQTQAPVDQSAQAYKFCTACGTRLEAEAKFCISCGHRLV